MEWRAEKDGDWWELTLMDTWVGVLSDVITMPAPFTSTTSFLTTSPTSSPSPEPPPTPTSASPLEPPPSSAAPIDLALASFFLSGASFLSHLFTTPSLASSSESSTSSGHLRSISNLWLFGCCCCCCCCWCCCCCCWWC